MDFRQFLDFLVKRGLVIEIGNEQSVELEIARIIHLHDGMPVLFKNVIGHSMPVVSGLFGFRGAFSIATNPVIASKVSPDELISEVPLPATNPASFIHVLYRAVAQRSPPSPLDPGKVAPCQEIEENASFIEKIPILKHLPGDGGRYITSGVAVYNCPVHGRNCSFHRMMAIGQDRLVARVVEDRGLDTALKATNGPLDAAIIIGSSPQVMVAASTSAPKGVDELSIANTLSPFQVIKCKGIDVEVPADSEIVIEGRFLKEYVAEGPFLDLTGTLDIVRKQPVFEIERVTHRKDPIYHALLPGGREHQLLMGLPREATMLMELLKTGDAIKDVRLTPGSSHWFNAVVQVDRHKRIDHAGIFRACMDGHKSLKSCIIVDDDINIDDPVDVEYAITTRSQFNKDLTLFPGERGSSLDPSADQVSRETCKAGINATMPRGDRAPKFHKQMYGDG